MAKMVGICLESPLGGSPNLNTILLDPLQNVSTSWELDLRNDLRDGGGNGNTPAQPPVHRAQRPEPPGFKKKDQHNENQPIIEVEVEIDNHRM